MLCTGAGYLCLLSPFRRRIARERELSIHIRLILFDRARTLATHNHKHISAFRLCTVGSFAHGTLNLECRIFGACGIKRDKSSTLAQFAQYFRNVYTHISIALNATN